MLIVLEEKDLWEILSGVDGVVEAQAQKYRRRAREALATMCLSLRDEQLSLVRSSKTATEAWNTLGNHYEVMSLANNSTFSETPAMQPSVSMIFEFDCSEAYCG